MGGIRTVGKDSHKDRKTKGVGEKKAPIRKAEVKTASPKAERRKVASGGWMNRRAH